MKLYEEPCTYTPHSLQEEADRKVMMRYIKGFPDVYTRDSVYGHITSSPWIINADVSKVPMIHHNIYSPWGWCGGHADGDQNLIHVALKEGREEIGLKKPGLLSESILTIDILPVPLHVKKGTLVSSHVHLGVIYLCQTDERDTLCNKPDENSGARWIAVEEIDHYVTEEDTKPVYRKLVEKNHSLLLVD